MKTLTLLTLLLPLYAQAAPRELICDPDTRITFHNRWFRGSLVKLEGDTNWELPWTGREAIVSGENLRAERLKDLQISATAATAAEDDELLNVVPERTAFTIYKQKSAGPNPLTSQLYVERSLLDKGEQDGIVISQQLQTLEVDGHRAEARTKIFHCRSR